ncbi:MAG TPA: CRTAC1 family protein [Acidimicrobiia bacterium]
MKRAWAAALLLTACTASGTVGPPSTEREAAPTTTAGGGEETTSLTCWTAPGGAGRGPIEFSDVTDSVNLVDPLTGMHGHAAIWTDVDGDDLADIYFGTYAHSPPEVYRERGAEGPSPDRLLISSGDVFVVDSSLPEEFSRSSGGAPVDLDADGDLDLVVTRNIKDPDLGQPPTSIFENDGGSLTSADSGITGQLGGRSLGVLDYDGDGRLDLFIAEDRWAGGSSVLLRNEGGSNFTDVTADAGIPDDVHGLGIAVADFDIDGLADIFVAGSNRLFLSAGRGTFVEGPSETFVWETFGDEDDVAGASVADVNRDGLLDLAVGHHYNSTVDNDITVAVRLYLNEGGGEFRDVTEEAGLIPLPTKAPHVELNDFDNDGWPDLLTSAPDDEGPAVFRHTGLEDGIPRFEAPTGLEDDRYWVAAPTADYDRDGRLDVFLVEWEPALPSLLLRNETESGNWLEVSVDQPGSHGIGWRVEVFDGDDLIGAREITVTQGYSAGVLPIAHFGLGDADQVTVRLTPPGADPIDLTDIAANQHIRWPDGCD